MSSPISLDLSRPPERIVSLVPSMTASMYDLDIGDRLVGITDYCPQPPGKAKLPCVGGTQNPSLDAIRMLQPDLVLANQEENDRVVVEQLLEQQVVVWTTFPQCIDEAIEILWMLIRIIPSGSQAIEKMLVLERSLAWAQRSSSDQQSKLVFYPIWMGEQDGEPWFMTVNEHTYAHDVLRVCGADNVFAKRERRYPLEADLGLSEAEPTSGQDLRYPRVRTQEVRAMNPELIILPDEPYAFTQGHITLLQELFSDTSAAQAMPIHLIDGRWVNWHGTMLAHALARLPGLIDLA